MATNKVQLADGTVLIDLTADTVTADKLLQGYTAHDASGAQITGTASGGGAVVINDTTDTHGGTIREITAVVLSGDTVTAASMLNGVTAHDASGTAITGTIQSVSGGTPTATKSAVNNHAVTVTPSVTNTTGYITGSTITGTAVSVSASELVSGNLAISQNGNNIDVTNYATVSVSVGGTSKNVQILQSTSRTTSTSYTTLCGDLTVSKAGTYHVYWDGFRTSTLGTWGTQLYINGSAYGSAQTTYTNNTQNIHLTDVSLSLNDKLAVYGRSRGNSYYACVGQLTIIEA